MNLHQGYIVVLDSPLALGVAGICAGDVGDVDEESLVRFLHSITVDVNSESSRSIPSGDCLSGQRFGDIVIIFSCRIIILRSAIRSRDIKRYSAGPGRRRQAGPCRRRQADRKDEGSGTGVALGLANIIDVQRRRDWTGLWCNREIVHRQAVIRAGSIEVTTTNKKRRAVGYAQRENRGRDRSTICGRIAVLRSDSKGVGRGEIKSVYVSISSSTQVCGVGADLKVNFVRARCGTQTPFFANVADIKRGDGHSGIVGKLCSIYWYQCSAAQCSKSPISRGCCAVAINVTGTTSTCVNCILLIVSGTATRFGDVPTCGQRRIRR